MDNRRPVDDITSVNVYTRPDKDRYNLKESFVRIPRLHFDEEMINWSLDDQNKYSFNFIDLGSDK